MPYVIDENNRDNYPLMEPFSNVPSKISVLSPLNQTYNETSVPLVFSVDKYVNWIGYSLDGKQNVNVTGNTTMSGLSSGPHNVTVYTKDVLGNSAISDAISFNVDDPFPTTLIATASAISITLIVVGLLLYFKKRKCKTT